MDSISEYRGAILPALAGVVGSASIVESGVNVIQENCLGVTDKTFRSLVRNVYDGTLGEELFFGHNCFFGP